MSLTFGQMLAHDDVHRNRQMLKAFSNSMRVAVPVVVVNVYPTTQTVDVQPLIMEQVINADNSVSDVALPLLLDCPISFPRAGGFAFTLPISAGDEGLVIFADMCIDGWFSNAGTSPTPQVQAEVRRHDLSDGIFVPGLWNQHRVLSNVSTTAMQMRNDAGTSYISLNADGSITIKGKTTTQTW